MTFISGALIASSAGKKIIHEYATASYSPLTYATILSRTTLPAINFYLQHVQLSAPCSGVVRIKIGSVIIAVGHLSPASLVYELKLPNPLPIPAGDTLVVEFSARAGAFVGSAHTHIHGYEV